MNAKSDPGRRGAPPGGARGGAAPASGYSGTPLWRKLGYKDGTTAFVEGEPATYRSLLGLPEGVEVAWASRPSAGMAFVHVFAVRRSRLAAALGAHLARLARSGVIWVSWPKKSSGVPTDITEDVIREVALPLGLVDVKVCAVDGTWSGLKLMVRRELR